MRAQGFIVVAVAVSAAACSPRYRKQVMGTARAGVPVPINGVGDAHRLDVQVQLPRAMVVRYEVKCPSHQSSGTIGEPWERYKTRRLAQLQRERERQKKMVGSVTGALLGRAGAGASVSTPAGDAQADVEVDGAAAGEAAAEATIAPVQMDPADTGARTWKRSLRFIAKASGACTLAFRPEGDDRDLRGVFGQLTVTRMVDRVAERRRVRVAANTNAAAVRGRIHASLVAQGADPTKRARERAAARARADADARARFAVELRIQRKRTAARRKQERRERLRVSVAYANRSWVKRWLTECGGDPHKRIRERREQAERDHLLNQERRRQRHARAEKDRARNERRMREWEVTLQARRERRMRRERIAGLRLTAALATRAAVKLRLHGLGAIDRPPRALPRPIAYDHHAPTAQRHGSPVDMNGARAYGRGSPDTGPPRPRSAPSGSLPSRW